MTNQSKPAPDAMREALTLKRKEVAKRFSESAMQGFDTAMDVALSAPVPSPDGTAESVAWRWRYDINEIEWRWVYTTRKPDWAGAIYEPLYATPPVRGGREAFYTILTKYYPKDATFDDLWQEIKESGIFK